MYEFDEGLAVAQYFYDAEKIKTVNGLYVIDPEEKERLEKIQQELYGGKIAAGQD